MIVSTIKKIYRILQQRRQASILAQKEARSSDVIRKNIEDACLWNYLFSNIPAYTTPPFTTQEEAGVPDDHALVQRIMSTYKKANEQYTPSNGFWDDWTTGLKKDIHDALLSNDIDIVASMLRYPATNNLFHGFDSIVSGQKNPSAPSQTDTVTIQINRFYSDNLLSLATAVGARRMEYPEALIHNIGAKVDPETPLDVDGMLDAIEDEIGHRLVFPSPFPQECGIKSKRGIVSYRAIQAVYQAWRIAQIARNTPPDFKVLEIGAGLGRTAYYANCFGIDNYTIVDIPLTNVAQSYFLGRVMGAEKVRMGFEAATPEQKVRILSVVDFADHDARYDLIVNCDSLTEMPRDVAQGYWDFARKASRRFLSINHEYNPFTVREIYKQDAAVRVERHPYPMRRGYVEEMITW